MNEKRILILTSDAGFGHRSAANAIETALMELGEPNLSISIVNPLEHERVPRLLRDSQSDYDRLVRESPHLYQLGYNATDQAVPAAVMDSALTLMLYEALRDTLNKYDPDAIINTFPLYQVPLGALFRVNGRRVPMITVVTDLISVHKIWFNNTVDALVVPTEEVRLLAIKAGVDENKIRELGIPVHPSLGKITQDKAALRRQLGWREDVLTFFAVGSKRVPGLIGMLRGLNHSALPIQLIISAGNDAELQHQAQSTEWHVPVTVYDYVKNMPDLLHATDVLICKAGGLITTEALACGLPLALVDVIPGQEQGNAQYVVKNGAGVVADDPLELLEYSFHWLQNDGATLRQCAERARGLGRPNAAGDVARMALQAADETARAKQASAKQAELSGNDLSLNELRQMLRRFGITSASTPQRYS
jgi:1,2-diacylglycerol 3-beta-galactosyltransferase